VGVYCTCYPDPATRTPPCWRWDRQVAKETQSEFTASSSTARISSSASDTLAPARTLKERRPRCNATHPQAQAATSTVELFSSRLTHFQHGAYSTQGLTCPTTASCWASCDCLRRAQCPVPSAQRQLLGPQRSAVFWCDAVVSHASFIVHSTVPRAFSHPHMAPICCWLVGCRIGQALRRRRSGGGRDSSAAGGPASSWGRRREHKQEAGRRGGGECQRGDMQCHPGTEPERATEGCVAPRQEAAVPC